MDYLIFTYLGLGIALALLAMYGLDIKERCYEVAYGCTDNKYISFLFYKFNLIVFFSFIVLFWPILIIFLTLLWVIL